MFKSPHQLAVRSLAPALLALLTLCLCSCGGGGEKTVATVGETKLSQATLSHWMVTTLGGDYRAAIGSTAPEGLVSDPVDYPRCLSAAAQVSVQAKAKLSEAQLRLKCRQLNAGIKEQALSYVLSVLWAIEEANGLGFHVSEAEVTRRMRELADRDYHGPVQFARSLAEQRRTIADERFLVKRNILEDLFLARIAKKVNELGGGQKTEVKLVLEKNARWTAKTDCSPGYLAWECKQYRSTMAASPAPAVVLEQLARGV